ncbi:hypothetical protein [Williamsia serinedens]|uniref:Uncharacterized protein n=1 Tax=Williamsia serinedens TaxID=391736 RepID=A0ABT1H734_9NOCA|nr:hypothetical protein [Williamsia serinedens]MCP2163035.1 hypothetical protein [Williamsia serinedens]
MLVEPELFAHCPLPGCDTLTATQGQPCDGCREAFGALLAHTPGGAPLTAADQAARDAETLAAYRSHAALTTADAGDDTEAGEGETRSNQRCWLCEQRRRCTRIARRWECRDCATIA